MNTQQEAVERKAGDRPRDPATGFGAALFDELKHTAIRRGGLATLARARKRLANPTHANVRALDVSELSSRLPQAVDSVKEFAEIVVAHARALDSIARRTSKIVSDGASIPPAIETAITSVSSLAAAVRVGPGTAQATEAQQTATAIGEILGVYGRVLRVDKKLDALSDRLRQIQTDQERLESDEIMGDEARKAALARDLVGLAFSGGGIRSATFNLGILQGLASFGLLGKFDYLSTVSGGGYIGSWLAAWIHREGDLENVQKQIRPMRIDQAGAIRGWCDFDGRQSGLKADPVMAEKPPLHRSNFGSHVAEEEPEAIYHLRQYCNYLAPQPGVLSVDTWSMLSTYGRNLLLNQLILMPAAMAVVLVPRIFLLFFQTEFPSWSRLPFGLAMFGLGGASLININQFVLTRRLATPDTSGTPPRSNTAREAKSRRPEVWQFIKFAVLPLVTAAVLFSFLFSDRSRPYLAVPILDYIVVPTYSTGRFWQAVIFGLIAGLFRFFWFEVAWLPSFLLYAQIQPSTAVGGQQARFGSSELALRSLISFLSAAASAGTLYAVLSWIRASLKAMTN